MKSRASFFNLTALRKNVLRFAPVWTLYTVFLLLVFLAVAPSASWSTSMVNSLQTITNLMPFGNLVYACIVALCLFGDLYKTRLACAMHAFPIRREGWLLTNAVTGLLFGFVPNLVVPAIASILFGMYANYFWSMYAIACLQYLFFFGTAVLSGLCAGKRLGMVAIYGIIHFIVQLIYLLADIVYQPLLFGIDLKAEKFLEFQPLQRLTDTYIIAFYESDYFRYIKDQWVYLGLCAAAGAVCLVLAWFVYRRRHLERAGDFVALLPLRAVFLVFFAVGVGVAFYIFSALFGEPSYVLYGAGLTIGYFFGRILVDHTLRVFYKKSLVGFGVLVAVLLFSMLLAYTDPIGVGKYIPPVHKVQSATIQGRNAKNNEFLILDWYTTVPIDGDNKERFDITDPEEIARLQEFHSHLAGARPSGTLLNPIEIRICYTLESGRQIERCYTMDVVGPENALKKEAVSWFSDVRYLFQVDNANVLYSLFDTATIRQLNGEGKTVSLTSDQIRVLLSALIADGTEGTLAQKEELYTNQKRICSIQLSLKDEYTLTYQSPPILYIYADSQNTARLAENYFASVPDTPVQKPEDSYGKTYYPDVVQMIDDSASIVIKEYIYKPTNDAVPQCSAEIYYQEGTDRVLLGKVNVGTSHCPFANGNYTLELLEEKLIVRWAPGPQTPSASWYQDSFPLPEK